MRAARLYGPRDLRLETLPIPQIGPRELLVRLEACGICPTDIRKHRIGLSDGSYPLNLGHEWVGRVMEVGVEATDWAVGDRVYGDTYAGYADFAALPIDPGGESIGAYRIPEDLPLERAVFLEPVADCLHAWLDGARLERGDRVLVFGAGQMGLQLVAVARELGAEIVVIEPLEHRRELALKLGASGVAQPDDLETTLSERWGDEPPVSAVVSIGALPAFRQALACVGNGARVVLFAGFGDTSVTEVDLNDIHYRELSVVGTTWIGVPPNQHWERYDQALEMLRSGAVPTDLLVTGYCHLDELEEHFERLANHTDLKTILTLGV